MNKFFAVLFLLSVGLSHAQKDSIPVSRLRPERGSWTQHHALFSFGIGNYRINPYNFYKIDTLKAIQNSTLSSVSSSVIHIKGEFAYNEHFGAGLSISQSKINYTSRHIDNYPAGSAPPPAKIDHVNLKIFEVNFRLNYHFFHAKIFDPYIGGGIGFRTYNYSGSNTIYKVFVPKMPFGYELTLGLRYLIASRFGVYAEAGLGRSLYQVGLTLNLGKLKKF